jgi:hypothetical protein
MNNNKLRVSLEDRESIDYILDCFDFNKVHEAMKALKWGWAKTDMEVPETWELRKQARELLEEVFVRLDVVDEYLVGTGGFQAIGKTYPRDTHKYVRLEFLVTGWDNYEMKGNSE